MLPNRAELRQQRAARADWGRPTDDEVLVGIVLERQDRDHCDNCMTEELRCSATAFREKGRSKLEVMRASGIDPAHSEEANRRRGKKVSEAQHASRKWDVAHGEADPEVFRLEILPRLQGFSLGAMARATGLSEGYCSFIRRGLKIPHARHWNLLRGITDVAVSEQVERNGSREEG